MRSESPILRWETPATRLSGILVRASQQEGLRILAHRSCTLVRSLRSVAKGRTYSSAACSSHALGGVEGVAGRMRHVAIFTTVIAALAIACGSETSDSRIVTTRQTAQLGGILTEDKGCLRTVAAGQPEGLSTALVWQKGIFEVTRSGDELTIVDLNLDFGRPVDPVIWRIGEKIRGSGGELRSAGVTEHAGADYLERCAGPYFLVSGVR